MINSRLKTGGSAGTIPTCRPPRGAKLDGHKAMLHSFRRDLSGGRSDTQF